MPATSDILLAEEVNQEAGGKEQQEKKNQGTETEETRRNFGFFCDERGYLDQIEHIMQHGRRKGDRTGTGVLSVFGAQARYSLRGESLFLLKLVLHYNKVPKVNYAPINLNYHVTVINFLSKISLLHHHF